MTHQPTSASTRRSFLLSSAKLFAGLLLSAPVTGYTATPRSHILSFYHTHTRQTLEVAIDLNTGKPQDRRSVYRFLRDFRTGEIHPIDFQLFEMLCDIQRELRSSGTYEIISGFRSPTTNEKLRSNGSGVAKKSLHMSGRAIDVRLSDCDTRSLKDAAWELKRGGVGFYPKSDFVHLDTGRVRAW